MFSFVVTSIIIWVTCSVIYYVNDYIGDIGASILVGMMCTMLFLFVLLLNYMVMDSEANDNSALLGSEYESIELKIKDDIITMEVSNGEIDIIESSEVKMVEFRALVESRMVSYESMFLFGSLCKLPENKIVKRKVKYELLIPKGSEDNDIIKW